MRLNPEKMAGLYWSMLRGRSIWEVAHLIKQYENSPNSRDYWLVVKSFLEGYANPKGNRNA